MKSKRICGTTIILVLLAMIVFTGGCVCSKPAAPYLEDRTVGWKPELLVTLYYNEYELDANGSSLWQSVIDFKPFVFSGQLTAESFPLAAEEAMKLNFGEDFFGLNINYELYNLLNTIGFITEEAAVLFETDTGRLMFCANIESNSALSIDNVGNLMLTVDAAGLTASQLDEINQKSNYRDYGSRVHLEEATLPLTAKGAYDLSVGMDLVHTGGSPRLSITGGAFLVYYSDVSDAFFVVTNTYIQAFDVSTGKLLMMNSYGSVGADEYPYGRDNSIME